MQGGGMKRLMMVKKRIKGQESQAADMFPIQQTIQDRRADNKKGLSVRESTRIHALTGVPWEQVNREVKKGERRANF